MVLAQYILAEWMNKQRNEQMTGRPATGKMSPATLWLPSSTCPTHPVCGLYQAWQQRFHSENHHSRELSHHVALEAPTYPAFVFIAWEYRKQWGCWRRYLFRSQTEKSGWFRGQRWQFLNMVWLTHAQKCSEFPLFCGRLGQTWPDWSFFEAQSNTRKTTPAALLSVEGALKGNSKIQRI